MKQYIVTMMIVVEAMNEGSAREIGERAAERTLIDGVLQITSMSTS